MTPDNTVTERRKRATKQALWKMSYYHEIMKNGKTDKEAREIANRFTGLNK